MEAWRGQIWRVKSLYIGGRKVLHGAFAPSEQFSVFYRIKLPCYLPMADTCLHAKCWEAALWPAV